MIGVELACFAIVTTWIALRIRREKDRAAFAGTIAAIAVAAFVAEDSAIRLYGFYAYDASWDVFLDRVPLAIVCIWPVVVLSSLDLARALVKQARTPATPVVVVAGVAALIVLADASLIEPIATASGLWAWTEPGPFRVPIIGILGWAYFALGAVLVVAGRDARPTKDAKAAPAWAVVVVAPLVAHVLLLATWWAALRWLPRGVDVDPFVVVAWVVAVVCAVVAVKRDVRVPRMDLLLRVPAASFFFVLLALHHDDLKLVAYALAFAPPYLVLTARAR
jgi:hypothetical protein